MDEFVESASREIAARAERELEALVGVSSPSGDIPGAEEALAICAALLPAEAGIERVPSSTPGGAPDLIARVAGVGERRIMLLGHVDTVIGHHAHAPLRRDGERLYGPGTTDMKGGVVLALGVARALTVRPEMFAELCVVLVTDEEWRTKPFAHVERFTGYDACLCFEAGERGPHAEEGVVVRRKAAGTLRALATGRPSHSGSAPDQGANALLALAQTAVALARLHAPAGPDRLSVVPTVVRSGDAFNVVPAGGELIFDLLTGMRGSAPLAIAAIVLIAGTVVASPARMGWSGFPRHVDGAALAHDGRDAQRFQIARRSSSLSTRRLIKRRPSKGRRPLPGRGKSGASSPGFSTAAPKSWASM